jgi:ferredoxin-type protein NapG
MSELSRRQFFRLGPIGMVEATVGSAADEKSAPPPVIRPPGAVRPEEAFTALCERCAQCAESCPHDAIVLLGPAAGADEGTPAIEPAERACHWCSDFPCITACPTDALRREPDASPAPIGKAALNQPGCLLSQGILCDTCIAVCPTSVRALRLADRRPQLDPTRCVGCGLCAQYCEAGPPALTVVPVT